MLVNGDDQGLVRGRAAPGDLQLSNKLALCRDVAKCLTGSRVATTRFAASRPDVRTNRCDDGGGDEDVGGR